MPFEWTDTIIDYLRLLWAEGLSTAEIGRRLHVTKNAVVGKAHRLHLEPRDSPIRNAKPRPRQPKSLEPCQAPTLPRVRASQVEAPKQPAPPVVPLPKMLPAPRLAAPAPLGKGPCRWPIGHPGTASFHFCGAPARPGRPYCADHARIAYVPRTKTATAADTIPARQA